MIAVLFIGWIAAALFAGFVAGRDYEHSTQAIESIGIKERK